jgi:hypothetical protein
MSWWLHSWKCSLCNFLKCPVRSSISVTSTTQAPNRQPSTANVFLARKKFQIDTKYRVIKKSLCTWWLQYRKLQVMFKVSSASLQIFTDTPNCFLEDRVQYSTVHILNVFCDDHLQIINCMEFVFSTVIIRCTETFWLLCSSKTCKFITF